MKNLLFVLLIISSSVFAQEGRKFLFDFGPNDVTNGNITVSPDINSNYWNNIIDDKATASSVELVDIANNVTEVSLSITSDFLKNGILNGGLLAPDSTLLGEFAIATATQDYFFTTGAATLQLTGLDKSKGFIFEFFGTRNSTSERITQYDLQGFNSDSKQLQTSGVDLGGTGYDGNNTNTAVSDTLLPDENGNISLSVSVISGGFAYLGLMQVTEVQVPQRLNEVSGILIDFGPNDTTNGNITISPDDFGNYWNNVIDESAGGDSVNLIDNANNETGVSVKVTAAFQKNGILNGGLLEPSDSLLGDFAVASATEDYFFQTSSGVLEFSGFDKNKGYVFHLFGTRNSTSERITQYDFVGENSDTKTLQTSGTDIGGTGYNGNNSEVAVSDTLIPDADGKISLTVSVVTGGFCYIGLMKVEEVELPKVKPVEVTGILVDFGPDDGANGNATENPDANGNFWNNLIDESTSGSINLVDNANNETGFTLAVESGFLKNGINHGGLLSPIDSLLGEFAVNTATQDYFFQTTSGRLILGGLKRDKGYVFQFFGTRNSTSERITQYTLTGVNSDSTQLQTSGTDIGGTGYNGNNSNVAVTDTLIPNDQGEIEIDVSVVAGGFCYIGLMKFSEVDIPPPPVKASGILIDFGPNDLVNGNVTVSPDKNGNHWNNATENTSSAQPLQLINNANEQTGLSLSIVSSFDKNGIRNGGFLSPVDSLLGEFAISTATQDYFFSTTNGEFVIEGFDNSKSYKFSFFASRNITDTRITKYELTGTNSSVFELQTSGTDLGRAGYHGNTKTVAVSEPVVPSNEGKISVKLSVVQGGFCYVALMKIEESGTSENLALQNTGFENGDLAGWIIYPPQDSLSAIISNAESNNGDYSVKISGDSTSLSQTISSISGDDQILSAYFYQPASEELTEREAAYLQLSYLDESNNFIVEYLSSPVTSSFAKDEWKAVSVVGTVPQDAKMVRASILFAGQSGGTVFVDDLSLGVYDVVVSECNAFPQFLDEGQNSIYMRPEFDDSLWDVIDIPNNTSVTLGANRTYWFRKTIDVNAALAEDSSFTLNLYGTEAADAVWFNGTLLGTNGFGLSSRVYQVNDSLVVEGENQITIQMGFVQKTSFVNPLVSKMLLIGNTTSEQISVAGDWQYSTGIFFTNENTYQVENKIVFMGSSVADGYGAPGNYGYASRYTDLLKTRFNSDRGKEWDVDNISIGGNNTNDLLGRFDRDLLPQCPRYVIYGLSLGNEGIHTGGQAAFDSFNEGMIELIQKAKDLDIIPIVVNCYTRSDFNAADYEFTKEMNLLIHEWDVPSVNLLGAVDDGFGRWVQGYVADPYHPNGAGHTEMFFSFVPSLFDALDEGKPMPEKVVGTKLTIENSSVKNPVLYKPDENMHSFTYSFDVNSTSVGTIASYSTANGSGKIMIDSTNGTVKYVAPSGVELTSSIVINDGNWSKISLSHYYARGTTFLYVDSVEVGSLPESLVPTEFILGGSGDENFGSPQSAMYRQMMLYRAGMIPEEITALSRGRLLKSSLELYAPLDEDLIELTEPLQNIAQSTTELINNLVTGTNDSWGMMPEQFNLFNNYPNPFNPTTIIKYALPKSAKVQLNVYNLLGEKVGELVNGQMKAGYHQVEFNSAGLASGIYIYRISAGEYQANKKMILLK
ncbi:MAG: T9SS type A sorting domain-containing protein [Melioribacteraceae bacterium]|nr:T9SS type A sorting domain-containing protein [Melioribacteraceae bacterium]